MADYKLAPSRLRQLLQERGITQKQLSEQSKLSAAAICQYAAGKIQPGPGAVLRLAAALGVSPGDLCEDQPRGTPGRITVADAAKCMAVSKAFIRAGMQSGRLDIGCAVRIKQRWGYFIIPDKLRAMAGAERFEQYFNRR